MPKTRNTYKEGTKIVSMCRVCLTQSKSVMFKLTDKLKGDDNLGAETYLEALERATFSKVKLGGNYPESICPMCVSFLKMALQFIIQFKDSQKRLQQIFHTSTQAYYDTIESDNNCEKPAKKVKIDNSDLSSVELIVKDQTYSLNDLVVVENPDLEEHDYKGFIDKLGNEISATIINNSTEENISPQFIKSENHNENHIEYSFQDENESAEGYIKNGTAEENEEIFDYVIQIHEDTDNEQSIEEEEEIETEIEQTYKDTDELSNENNESKYDLNNLKEDVDSRTQSESDNLEYIEIDMYNKADIESLIIDRGILNNEEDDDSDAPKVKRRRKRKKVDSQTTPKDEFEREVKFPCGICKKIFPSIRSLKNHSRRTHTEKHEKIFTCEICGTICETRSKFVNHKLQHVEKQFKCDQCDKSYSTKAHLKVHLSVHANIRPYLCNVCGKDFNYANALTYHMRLHTGEKNYHCEYCSQRFRMINSLNRHLRTHTGERPYKCQYCGKSFSSKGEVVCHEYIHTGYRPYHCKYCKKGFSKTHNLKIHLLSHGGPYECRFCTKTFIEESILVMHNKIAHGDLMNEINAEENICSNEGYDEIEAIVDDDDSNMEYVEADDAHLG